tara:strand:+ start:192 stop:557 length:366 start_codon:yes stop_codon:yes gene_type:complete
MIFFRQKLEEVITLPPPPKDDMAEALKVNEITLTRTPEQVQSVRDHDQDPYFAIKKVIKKYKLAFHPNELEQILKESVPLLHTLKIFTIEKDLMLFYLVSIHYQVKQIRHLHIQVVMLVNQ